ncbi:PREDICTED: F-box/LRR-repeat protein At4g14103-like isoform X1 [Fragaria vesca subsp. vesca]|uniref:F-box/LRR-repeat protein At4g14103-like isoform X1 n=2 Tax=Fragaria vesca subsp. vesca TaxID=101020 RepID=UPI0002C2EB3E|nr:PREDICTED: F-box/LRR-repeat protein At4g14103-like isoform X1 [Fragaria vesca subsp. vesca]
MERHHKALATTSHQSQGAGSYSLVDRFSSLPDAVVSHILSYLNAFDLIQVSSVSKKCGELSVSVSGLDFDVNAMPGGKVWWMRSKLLNYLDRLWMRRENINIDRFRVCWVFEGVTSRTCEEHCRVISWIYAAVRCNVEKLDLQITLNYKEKPTSLELPGCTFRCASLTSLTLDLKFCILKTPSVSSCTNLQSLLLRSVCIEKDFFEWISSSCQCIKELTIDCVLSSTIICIEIPSLEFIHFVFVGRRQLYTDIDALSISGENLQHIHVEHIDLRSSACHYKLSITAPNVKYLKLNGNVAHRLSVEKFIHSEEAVIFLNPGEGGFDKVVFDVVSCILGVKVLRLNATTIKALFKYEGSMLGQFDNIRQLYIHTKGLEKDLIAAVVSLLSGMPTLSSLNIKSEPNNRQLKCVEPTSVSVGKKWRAQRMACIDQLKEVTIEISNGNKELELARFLLEDAKNLKKMVLQLSDWSYSPKKVLLARKLSSYSSNLNMAANIDHINSTATIVFEAA